VERYSIDVECLLFDNTNFFTYLNTSNPSTLGKRGNSKEKRKDLKIVGLSLMVSPEHNIPLFHEMYPGNKNDAHQFSGVIAKLKERYRALGKGDCVVTLVFDKGNNNEDNIQELLETDPCPFHFVGGLRLNQCNELLDVPKTEFITLDGDFHETTAHRTKWRVYGKEFTTLVTYNPELYKAQMVGMLANIASCENALTELGGRLRLRESGAITKGKKPTIESVSKNVLGILSAEHMKDIFDYEITGEPERIPTISFALNGDRWALLQERILGKTILFTDHAEWTNVQIVSAYRSQYHVEEAFKQMKDTKYLSFRPMHHFTDENIRVHGFYCVLALLLTCLLNKELEQMGHKMSIRRMLDRFREAQQVISIYAPQKGKPAVKTAYSRFEGVSREYAEKYRLLEYLG
jgi:transposase